MINPIVWPVSGVALGPCCFAAIVATDDPVSEWGKFGPIGLVLGVVIPGLVALVWHLLNVQKEERKEMMAQQGGDRKEYLVSFRVSQNDFHKSLKEIQDGTNMVLKTFQDRNDTAHEKIVERLSIQTEALFRLTESVRELKK